jgi:Domain of unknown function (DUF4279)
MNNEISVSFTLTGLDLDPEQITKLLKISPTNTWRLGDLIGKSILRCKHNGWRLNSELENSADLENHIEYLLKTLQQSWQTLVEICSQYDAEISCVIYSYEAQGPAIHFDKEIIQCVAELNAEIDVDYYCLHSSKVSAQ